MPCNQTDLLFLALDSYVDAQLRTSKRFDAAGIKADHPEFFVPVVRRRSSSSASVNTLNGSGFGSDASGSSQGGEGQLRYWTSDMCAKSPHLFDFVVTVSLQHVQSDSFCIER